MEINEGTFCLERFTCHIIRSLYLRCTLLNAMSLRMVYVVAFHPLDFQNHSICEWIYCVSYHSYSVGDGGRVELSAMFRVCVGKAKS